MLNGDGNENGVKINRSNQQKNKLHVCTCNTLFVFLCHCFPQLQRCFVGLNHQTSQLHVIIMEELSYVLTQYFVSCVHFRFYFSLPLIFTLLAGRSLLATSISHYLTATLNFHVFFLQSSPLLFSITRSSSFFVIHMNVNMKNSIKKDTTFLCFFFLKSRRTGPCDFFPNKTLSCNSVAIPID